MLSCCKFGRRKKRRREQLAKQKPVWATPKPKTKAAPVIIFLGLDNSGKTSLISTLLSLKSPGDRAATLPVAPAPTTNVVYSTVSTLANEFVAVDVPGVLSQRSAWSEPLESVDGVVLVVDSTDDIRCPVISAELMRAMPILARRGVPLLVLAMKQDSPAHKRLEELQWNLNLARICARLPAPWALRGCSILDRTELSNALAWLLGIVVELQGMSPEAVKEKRAEFAHANSEYAASVVSPAGVDELA